MKGAWASERLTTAHWCWPTGPLWNGTGETTVVVPAAPIVATTSDRSVPAEPTPPGKVQKRTMVSGAPTTRVIVDLGAQPVVGVGCQLGIPRPDGLAAERDDVSGPVGEDDVGALIGAVADVGLRLHAGVVNTSALLVAAALPTVALPPTAYRRPSGPSAAAKTPVAAASDGDTVCHDDDD